MYEQKDTRSGAPFCPGSGFRLPVVYCAAHSKHWLKYTTATRILEIPGPWSNPLAAGGEFYYDSRMYY